MNKKNILYTCFVFFILTIFFQIGILIKLNQYQKKINSLTSKTVSNTKIPDLDSESTTTTNSMNETSETTQADESINLSDYDNLNEVFSLDSLKQIFEKSLFIGDSRTEGLYKFSPIADYADFCCGPGYNISTIKEKRIVPKDGKSLMDSIAANQYDSIFLCFGFNELGWNYPETFIKNYIQFINDIKTLSPETKLYIIGIMNVCEEFNSLEEYENNNRISQYNEMISYMCESNDFTYLNFNEYFINSDRNLNKISTEDGIHFNAQYYKYYLYRIIQAIQ